MTDALVVDLFAGPGGWDTGCRLAGYTGRLIGIEQDKHACATAIAAGHPRIQADVSTYPVAEFGDYVDGLIASPPCQAWSLAGDRRGKLDQEAVFERIAAFAAGRAPAEHEWADERSFLTAEPMRWAAALRPRWIALEQVPAVLPLWQYMAELLRKMDYRVWCGILSTEEYGVPQTRKRAFLTARRDGLPVGPPEPTHQPYRARKRKNEEPDLFGDQLPPPVSMAQALGWPDTWQVGLNRGAGISERHGTRPDRSTSAPAPTIRGGSGGGCGPNLIIKTDEAPGAERDPRPVDAPSCIIRANGSGSHPSGTEWVMRNGNQANACARSLDEPAGTVFFGARVNVVQWVHERPSTTVCGDARIGRPGHKDRDKGEAQFERDSVRVTVEEAGVLQSFPVDYPWQGTKSARYRQIGDAVPPLMAAALLRPLLPAAEEEGVAC